VPSRAEPGGCSERRAAAAGPGTRAAGQLPGQISKLRFPGSLSISVAHQQDVKCVSLLFCWCLLDIPLTFLIFPEEGSCGLVVQTL